MGPGKGVSSVSGLRPPQRAQATRATRQVVLMQGAVILGRSRVGRLPACGEMVGWNFQTFSASSKYIRERWVRKKLASHDDSETVSEDRREKMMKRRRSMFGIIPP